MWFWLANDGYQEQLCAAELPCSYRRHGKNHSHSINNYKTFKSDAITRKLYPLCVNIAQFFFGSKQRESSILKKYSVRACGRVSVRIGVYCTYVRIGVCERVFLLNIALTAEVRHGVLEALDPLKMRFNHASHARCSQTRFPGIPFVQFFTNLTRPQRTPL